MRATTRSFPLREGQCILHHDRIELVHAGLKGWFLAWANKRKLTSMAFWYFMGALGFLFTTLLSVIIDNWFLAFFFFAFALLSVVGSVAYRNLSLRTSIEREFIEDVVFREAVEGVSRASFEVYFRPNKQLRMRKLLLPGKHQQGGQIANSAFWMMKEEGLIKG